MSQYVLHIRASSENERGPLYMESVLSSMHSLKGIDKAFSVEVGQIKEGKIAFFVRGTISALQLAESQLYAQYPDIEIERLEEDPFEVPGEEEVMCIDLDLEDPEVYPIKRHPQFDDMLGRVNVSPIAGVTSAIAHRSDPSLRAHVAIHLRPLKGGYRRRALRVLPLLATGVAGAFPKYARFLARLHLARGWKRWAYAPLSLLLGGWKALPLIGKSMQSAAQSSAFNAQTQFLKDDDFDDLQASARTHDREDSLMGAQDKVNKQLFLATIHLHVCIPKGKHQEGQQKLQELLGSFQQFNLPHSNSFRVHKQDVRGDIAKKLGPKPFILSVEEIATIWHLPTILVQTPTVDMVESRKVEPPLNLPIPGATDPEDSLTIMGEAVYRGQRKRFGIRPDDRRRHTYIIGKTGMGKSTLLENMICSDILKGSGLGVIDPHGDLIDAVLQFVPKSRTNDVLLFEPADPDYCVSFNMLECRNPSQRSLIASGIMAVFTKLWPDVWSGRMEHILRNSLLTLIENEGTSMLGMLRLFADSAYRAELVKNVSDPLVKSFWEDEFNAWDQKYRTEAVAAIQNKIGQLLTVPLIRNIIGQVKSSVDIRHAMDTGKIVLVNLSKGKIGEDTSAFLGSMLVTKFQIDAMSRADTVEEDRRDFHLYVDEFQNFATKSFATILSEARKYRLTLTMANQYVSQLLINGNDSSLRDAVFGNVGTLLSFQVGSDDAEVLSLQFEEAVTMKDILSLPKYQAYVRLMINGMPSKPFSVATLPPPDIEQHPRRVETIRKLSRERYSVKRERVEEKILGWASTAQKSREAEKDIEKQKEKEQEEIVKAKKKGMKLDEYRAWRDREMWTNDYNVLRKKKIMGEQFTEEEQKQFAELEKKLEGSGGVPELSKALLKLQEEKSGSLHPSEHDHPEHSRGACVVQGKGERREVREQREVRELKEEKDVREEEGEKGGEGKKKKKRGRKGRE